MDDYDGELESSQTEPKKSFQKEIIDTGLPRENPIRKDLGTSQQRKMPPKTSELPPRLQPIQKEPDLSKSPNPTSLPETAVPILKPVSQEQKPNFIPTSIIPPRQDSLPNSGPPVLGQKTPTNPFFQVNPSKKVDNPSIAKPQGGNENLIKPDFKPPQSGGGLFFPPGANANSKPISEEPGKPFVGTDFSPKPFVESSKVPIFMKPPNSAPPVSLPDPQKTNKFSPVFDETSKNPVKEADMRNLSNPAMPTKIEDKNLPPKLGFIPPPKLSPSEPGKTEAQKIPNAPFVSQGPFKSPFVPFVPPTINSQISPPITKPPSNLISPDINNKQQFPIPIIAKPPQSSSNESVLKPGSSQPEAKFQPNIGTPGFSPQQSVNNPGSKPLFTPPGIKQTLPQGINMETNPKPSFIPPGSKILPPQGPDSKSSGPKPNFFIPGAKPNSSQESDNKDQSFKPTFIPPGAKISPPFKTGLNPESSNPPSFTEQNPKVAFVPPQGSGNVDQKSKGVVGFSPFNKPPINTNIEASGSKNTFIPPLGQPIISASSKEPNKPFVPPSKTEPVLTSDSSEPVKKTQIPFQVPKTTPEPASENLPRNPPFVSFGPPPSLKGKNDPKPSPFIPESKPIPKLNSSNSPVPFPVQKDIQQGAKPLEPPNLAINPLQKPTFINIPNSQALNINQPETKKIEHVFNPFPSSMANKSEPKNPFADNQKPSSLPPNVVIPETIKQGPIVTGGQNKNQESLPKNEKPFETKTPTPVIIPPMKYSPSENKSQNIPPPPLNKPSEGLEEKKAHEKQFDVSAHNTDPNILGKNYPQPFIPSIIDIKNPKNPSETKDTGFPTPFIPSIDLSKAPQNKPIESQVNKPSNLIPSSEKIMKNQIKPPNLIESILQSDKKGVEDDKIKFLKQDNKDIEPKIPSVSEAKPQFKPSGPINFGPQVPNPNAFSNQNQGKNINNPNTSYKETPQPGNFNNFAQKFPEIPKMHQPAYNPGYETVPVRHNPMTKPDNETSSNLSKSRLSTRQAPVYLPSPQPPSLKRPPTRPQESVSSKLNLISLLITLINPEKSIQVKDMIVKVCPELKEDYPKICENIFEKINNICYCNFCKKNETRFELTCTHKLCQYCASNNLINRMHLSTLPELGCPICKEKISYQDLENIYPKEKISERYALESNLIDKALNMYIVSCAKCKKLRGHDMFYDKSCLHMCKECIATSIRWKKYECEYCGGNFGDNDEMNYEKKYCDGCKSDVYYIGDYVKKMNDGCFLCSNCLQDTYSNRACKGCLKMVNQQELCEIDGFLYDICNSCGNEFDVLNLRVLMCCKNLVCEGCSAREFCEFCVDQEN